MKNKLLLFIGFLCLLSCKINLRAYRTDESKRGLIAEKAMVVSARDEASKIGVDIMRKGGNAFDAMVGTSLALAVAYPFAGNLGGGGFMVFREYNGNTGTLDFREKAPLLATKDMYLDSLGNVIPYKSTLGAMAVGVPGTIAGIFEVYNKFGSLPLIEIFQPVIELAQKGVVVTIKQENRIRIFQPQFKKVNKYPIIFDSLWRAQDTIKHPELAKTLKRILHRGVDEFYKGKTAINLVRFIQENGGIITMEDLARYKAKWRDPIRFSYGDLQIISMPPPSSGGICLAQIMKMIEPYPLEKFGHNSVKYIQLLTEAERRAYADRSHYLGDPDFVNIPVDELIDKDYLKSRMEDVSFKSATLSSQVAHGRVEVLEGTETTHFSIIDQFGNSVSVTTTLNGAYGSKLFCSELGFFLNNEMDDFSSKPGVPNMFGLIGAEANSIAPEKRMLSSMTPTIVEKNGKLHMSLGTPGGSTIITSVLQTLLNVNEFKMTMKQAVDSPRFHHQWLPDEIRMEPDSFDRNVINQLQLKGYLTNEENSPVIGKVDGILVLKDGKLEGGADKRGDDEARGF